MTYDKQYVLNVAATAQNILDGIGCLDGSAKGTKITDNWEMYQQVWESAGMGFIEFNLWIGEIAMYSEDQLRLHDPQDFPGVYDYEVSCEVGKLIGLHMLSTGSLPSSELWKRFVGTSADAFFAQGG